MDPRSNKTADNSSADVIDKLEVRRQFTLPPVKETLPRIGDISYNSTTGKLEYYNGSWQVLDTFSPSGTYWQVGGNNVGSDSAIGLSSANKLSLITNNIPRMSILSNGTIDMSDSAGLFNSPWGSGILRSTAGVVSSGALSVSDLPFNIPYNNLSLTGSILDSDIASVSGNKITSGTIPYARLGLGSSIVDSDIVSVGSSKITGTIPYNKLALTDSVKNEDIISLDYGKLINTPASASSVNMLDGSIAKIATGVVRITYTDGVYDGSVVGGRGLYWGGIIRLGDSQVTARVHLTTGFGTCFSAQVCCGRLPFAGVYIPRIESDITGGPVGSIDIRLYKSYDGSALGSLSDNGAYDFPLTVMGII